MVNGVRTRPLAAGGHLTLNAYSTCAERRKFLGDPCGIRIHTKIYCETQITLFRAVQFIVFLFVFDFVLLTRQNKCTSPLEKYTFQKAALFSLRGAIFFK